MLPDAATQGSGDQMRNMKNKWDPPNRNEITKYLYVLLLCLLKYWPGSPNFDLSSPGLLIALVTLLGLRRTLHPMQLNVITCAILPVTTLCSAPMAVPTTCLIV